MDDVGILTPQNPQEHDNTTTRQPYKIMRTNNYEKTRTLQPFRDPQKKTTPSPSYIPFLNAIGTLPAMLTRSLTSPTVAPSAPSFEACPAIWLALAMLSLSASLFTTPASSRCPAPSDEHATCSFLFSFSCSRAR